MYLSAKIKRFSVDDRGNFDAELTLGQSFGYTHRRSFIKWVRVKLECYMFWVLIPLSSPGTV